MRGELRRNPQNRRGRLPRQLSLPLDLELHFQVGPVVIGRGPPWRALTQASASILGPPATAVRLGEEVPELMIGRLKPTQSNGFLPEGRSPVPGRRLLQGPSCFCSFVFSSAFPRAGWAPSLYRRKESRTHPFNQKAHIFFTFKELRGC